jgi:hypothetical protein
MRVTQLKGLRRYAVNDASVLLRCIGLDIGLPDWPRVRAGAIRENVLDEDLAHPAWPDLVSGTQAAEILGVTSEQFLAMMERDDFPKPGGDLRTANGSMHLESAAFGLARTGLSASPILPGQRRPGGQPAAATAVSRAPRACRHVRGLHRSC